MPGRLVPGNALPAARLASPGQSGIVPPVVGGQGAGGTEDGRARGGTEQICLIRLICPIRRPVRRATPDEAAKHEGDDEGEGDHDCEHDYEHEHEHG